MVVAEILRSKGTTVHSVSPDATVLEAARLLNEKRVGALLVRGAAGAIEGVISERDIVIGFADKAAEIERATVRSLMTPAARLVTCAPQDPIDRIMTVMTDRRVRHLPVMDGGRLAGMISIGDVVKARIRETVAEVEAMAAYVRG
jgi:CBS domain-containing protein